MIRLRWLFGATAVATLPSLAYADAIGGDVTRQPTNWSAVGMFVVFVCMTLGITYWAAKQTKSAGHHRLPERLGDRGRLHVGGVLPRHLGPCLHVGL